MEKTIAEKIKDLIDEKKNNINQNGYFTLIIKVYNKTPAIMKIETSLKPEEK